MVGQQQGASDPLELTQPDGRHARHAIGDLAQHEGTAHRHAVHRAAGQAGHQQAERQGRQAAGRQCRGA